MQTEANRPSREREELIDTLIAISVVAKRLAEKLRRESGQGGT